MIERDRNLLGRLAEVNHGLGGLVVELMARQDGGELPAGPLRDMARALGALAGDMAARADELDGSPVGGRVVESGAGER